MVQKHFLTYLEKLCWCTGILFVGLFVANELNAQAATQEAKETFANLSGTVIESKAHNHLSTENIGLLTISSVNIEAAIFDGTEDATLDKGVGRVRGTSYFELPGNVAIAGHRDSFFRNLQHIKKGDEIEIVNNDGTYIYEVQDFSVIEPTNISVLQDTDDSTVTLITCYPFNFIGNAPQRFIVQAKQRAFSVHYNTK